MPKHFDKYQAAAAVENYSENAADSSNRYGLPYMAITKDGIITANLERMTADKKRAAIELLRSTIN